MNSVVCGEKRVHTQTHRCARTHTHSLSLSLSLSLTHTQTHTNTNTRAHTPGAYLGGVLRVLEHPPPPSSAVTKYSILSR